MTAIEKLKKITEVSMRTVRNHFFVLKDIILDHEKRIQELDFKVAELKGEVEPDEPKHPQSDFSDLEQLQEELSTPPYIPGQRVIHTKSTFISGTTLLQKARQMYKEQQFLAKPKYFKAYTVVEEIAYLNRNNGILIGIDRIIKLIERHFKQ